MAAAAPKKSEDTADREMRITRLIRAPREKIFDAFLDPANIGRWWGPNGFTTTTTKMEPKVGGAWIYTMHGPDGTDYPNRIDYLEIDRPTRMVYDHGDGLPGSKPLFRTTITLETRADGTFVTLCALFPTAQAFEAVKKFGAVEGGHQTVAKLAAYVEASK